MLYTFSQSTPIEHILTRGGTIDHLWSPRAKFESTKTARSARGTSSKTNKYNNLRRILFALANSNYNSRSNSGQQIPNYKYTPSINDNRPKTGKVWDLEV